MIVFNQFIAYLRFSYLFSTGRQPVYTFTVNRLPVVQLSGTKSAILDCLVYVIYNKNSSADEIANVNFYAVRPEATGIRWNNAK